MRLEGRTRCAPKYIIEGMPEHDEMAGRGATGPPVYAAEPGRTQDLRPGPVVVFAWFVAFLVLAAAYASDRGGWVDELGFQNPPWPTLDG
jgi:hypothetical protein